MHERVATVFTPELDETTRTVRAIDPHHADLVEVRLDALWPTLPDEDEATEALLHLTAAASEAGTRLLATLRPQRQGGRFDGPEEVRLGLLVAACKAGFAVADIEADHAENQTTLAALREHGIEVLSSDHTLTDAPSRDDGLLRLLAMHDLKTHAEKLAFPCGSFLDALRALELVHAHGQRHGRPAIAPIGGGASLRALLAVAGNRATYGHADGLPPAVPGQPALADVQAVWDHWGLAPDDLGREDGPPWLAVLGDPVDHSLSPAIHNAALRSAGRPERFGALQVPDSIGALRLLTTAAARLGLVGASVTAPLKHHAHDVAQRDDVAAAVGAVNCIRFSDNAGTNTDALALRRLLEPTAPSRVTVLGAGGAARAAIWAAHQVGADVVFTSRDEARARTVREATGAQWVGWGEHHDLRADAIVQATPLGSGPEDPSPLATRDLEGCSHLIEMVYAAGPTPLQQAAVQAGMQVTDGCTCLIEQAVDAYRFWFDQAPDRTAMEAALT